jgi:hypothetical protein
MQRRMHNEGFTGDVDEYMEEHEEGNAMTEMGNNANNEEEGDPWGEEGDPDDANDYN